VTNSNNISEHQRKPPAARRSWLFVEGASLPALHEAAASGADVAIQELEDFTSPERRPYARDISPDILNQWQQSGIIAAVRVNPLEGDGLDDLVAVMRGAPDIILLPKVDHAGQIERLDNEITRLEQHYGLPPGTTEIVPNVELAAGLLNTFAICKASPRISGCLVASEDMAADLGAERSRDGAELDYVRARFHVECVAAGVLSIDCPYTWTDAEGVEAHARKARRLGYRAKSAVATDHVAIINRVFTPPAEEIEQAKRIVAAFEQAQREGRGRVELDGSLVEVPIYLNARRVLERAALLQLI
jgi:citrate lyase subunit beta/citryl-CoA lyase